MDIKHVLSLNPLRPAYAGSAERRRDPRPARAGSTSRAAWSRSATTARASPSTTSCPATSSTSQPYRLADRLVTNGEWLEFMADGGYHRPELWLSDGWAPGQRRGLGRAALLDRARRRTGSSTPSTAPGRSTPGCRSATSASTRPRPTPRGPASGCRPRPSGSTPRPRRSPAPRTTSATSPTATTFHPRAAGRGDRRAAPAVRRLLGVDLVGVPPLPRLPPADGRDRRVQRQVHVQPDGAARRLRVHAGRATPGRPTATSSRTAPAGRCRASGWPRGRSAA